MVGRGVAGGVSGKRSRDRLILYAAAFLRALATGMVAVLIGIHLAKIGFDPVAIGLIVTAGLAGAAVAALLVTLAGDRLGRRRALVMLALLGALGGAVVAIANHPLLVGLAAFFGMLNGMGRDRGASMVLDQAVLPSTVPDERRTIAFAYYNVVQDAGHALGSLFAALPVLLRRVVPVGETDALRLAVGGYAFLLLLTAILYRGLSTEIESTAPVRAKEVTPATRRIVTKISLLFGLDGLGGGFLTTAMLSLFFYTRFHVGEAVVGALFFGARLMNAVSHLGAAWLARRIGLLNTMVFTHVPSSLLLVTVPFAPSFPIAAILFLIREGLVEMDVPTRQSYAMAVVDPDERTATAGITNVARTAATAVSPTFVGMAFSAAALGLPFFISGTLKIAYDLAIWFSFRDVRPPEEIERQRRRAGE